MYLGRIVENGPADAVLAAIPESGQAEEVTATISDTEPADPHRPPTGCRCHARCPVGPFVRTERGRCRTENPSTAHRNHAARHFAATARRSSM